MTEQRPGEGGPANSPPFPRPPQPAPPAGAAEDRSVEQTPSSTPDAPANHADRRGDSAEDGDEAPLPSRTPRAAEPAPAPRGARHFASAAGEAVRRRAERGIHRGFERVAERLEDAADRLAGLAEDRSGEAGQHRVGSVAHATAGWMDGAAEYLRSRDLDGLHADLERLVRERPLQTIVLAATTGWILGKIMR
jgi:ElaB/YqjD/DUF883 family membrane-anchored ribosome-binding protein